VLEHRRRQRLQLVRRERDALLSAAEVRVGRHKRVRLCRNIDEGDDTNAGHPAGREPDVGAVPEVL